MTYTPGPYDEQYPPHPQPYGPPEGTYNIDGWPQNPQPQYAPPPPPTPPQHGMGYTTNYQPYPPPTFAPPAPPRKRRKKNGGLIALAVVGGFLVLLCGIIAVAASNDDTSNSPGTAAPASGAAGIAQWAAGGGSALLDKLTTDFTAVGNPGGGTTAAMHDACTHIQTDVEAAQAYAPIPDAQAQTSWSKALALFARGAADCLAGTERQDAALQNKAADEFNQGTAALSEAAARIRQLGK